MKHCLVKLLQNRNATTVEELNKLANTLSNKESKMFRLQMQFGIANPFDALAINDTKESRSIAVMFFNLSSRNRNAMDWSTLKPLSWDKVFRMIIFMDLSNLRSVCEFLIYSTLHNEKCVLEAEQRFAFLTETIDTQSKSVKYSFDQVVTEYLDGRRELSSIFWNYIKVYNVDDSKTCNSYG